MTNPILQDWATPFQIAPFDAIADTDFAPALEKALAAHKAAHPEFNIEAVHIFPLGGIKTSAEWLQVHAKDEE